MKETYTPTLPHRWPEGAIVYHIYPRSLQDSNGDGIGDLAGITSRIPYIADLGANAIWLSPFYPSPMADFGYDIADYCDVDPLFGTLDDFKELLTVAHEHKLKVMVDLVPNHTSDEHEWFRESRQSKDNPYADWYIWRDARQDPTTHALAPPNNWRDALTGGSAWEWDATRGQYYLHSFDVRQPDLNWSNPAVRDAMKDVMRFWLKLGVDGFRVDAVYWMGKEPLLSDDAYNPDYVEGEDLLYEALLHNNSRGWPAVYAYLSEMADVLKEDPYSERQPFMVTEAYPERHNPIGAYLAFYASIDPAVAAPFNFEGISLPWKAGEWRRFLKSFNAGMHQLSPYCVPSYAFGNHDQPRLASRVGDEVARSIAVLLLTLPGMSFIYYGEELGMHNVPIPPEAVHDPAAKGDPLHGIGRDPERTPMQWSGEKHAGFSEASPWLPLSEDYKQRNVAAQQDDPTSMLNLYKKLAHLRNNSPALQYGRVEVLEADCPDVLAYMLTHQDQRFAVAINFSDEPTVCHLHNVALRTLAASSDPQRVQAEATDHQVELGPHEAVLYEVAA